MAETPALTESLKWLGTILVLGLLVGLERERKGDSHVAIHCKLYGRPMERIGSRSWITTTTLRHGQIT